MKQEHQALLDQGINAVRGGNKREGARILAQVVRAEPQSAESWFWLASSTDQTGEAKACLERALKIDPSFSKARQALNFISQNSNSTPPLTAFTAGDSGPASSTFSPPPPPINRALDTRELLGNSSVMPETFNSSSLSPLPPYSSNTGSPVGYDVVPPPFEAPTPWNQEGSRGMPSLPSYPDDPYASNTATMTAIPAPPISPAIGMRFGQLDPAAAAAQTQQALLEEQAGPRIYDPGAEIRRSLLGEDPDIDPETLSFDPAFENTNVPIPSGPTKARKISKKLLRMGLVGLAAVVLLVAFLATRLMSSPDPVSQPDIASQATTAATTSSANSTTIPATTSELKTTAAAIGTTAPSSTAASNTVPASPTAGSKVILPQATSAVNPTPTSGLISGQTGLAGSRTAGTAPNQLTIAPPQRTPTLPAGSVMPASVQQYLNEANGLINQMGFVEGQINGLLVQPYKQGKYSPGTAIAKPYEISYYTLLMGQLAAKFRELTPPSEAYDIHQLGLDYANDIREAALRIDRFYDTGTLSYMGEVASLINKGGSDRTKWFLTTQAGYPFRVNF